MTRRQSRLVVAGGLVLASVGLAAEPPVGKIFARGVYHGIDVRVNAAAAGKDVPAFWDQLFRDLRQTHHCNLFWVNDGGIPEQLQALESAARHGIRILCNVYGSYSALHCPLATETEMETRAKQVMDAFRDKSACAGYVLWDEPSQAVAPQLECYRRLLERLDPSRPAMLVTMCGATPVYAYRTGFPILCSDAYLFGAPNWTYCPSTPESSRNYYTHLINGLGDLSRKSRKPAWAMPQAYAGAEGKYWIDTNGNLILEPGSAWANRMPTPAEIRFQIWDAIRAGCRGVVFFILLPYQPDWRPDKQNLSEAEQKWGEAMDKSVASLKGRTDIPLVKQRLDTGGPATLLHRDGSGTPQSRAMGETFAVLEKLEVLLAAWTPAAFPAVFAAEPAAVRTFESPDQPTRLFATVVNHDTAAKRSLDLLLAPNVTRVTDLRAATDIPVTPLPNDPDGLLTAAVALDAGDGTVLELAVADDRPGMPLFAEDFSRFSSPVLLENAERINLPFPSGMGDYWAVRKARTPTDANAAKATGLVTGRQEGPVPCARLTRLQNLAHQQGPLGGCLGLAAQGLCDVFLAVEGSFPKAESLIIETVNTDGQGAWLRSDAHFHSARIPPKDASGKDIAEVRFILADDALLTGIRCWRVPRSSAAGSR